ncbi:hypothetical protein ACJMK2_041266 [Sinanodonta woodiana]|uniref:Uncharacterized protein n=1 Tax=Sinanodonta woodiana TaxID=1069815 RepID=A0ABD3W7C5_SINWO
MEDISFGKKNLNEELETFERYSREEMLEIQAKCVDSLDNILPEECPRTTLKDTGKCDVIKQKMYPDLARFDPLGDFLILRSSKPVTSVDQVTSKDLVQRVIRCQESKTAVTIAQIANAVPEAENNIVPVKISDDLSYLLKQLEEVALSSMQTLKNSGGIAATYSFHSLTPDITRFFLKQLTHHLKETACDVTVSENYKAAVIVHAMVGAGDLLLNCCLESAIGFISAVQERYNSILKGRLQSVRQKLCDVKVSMHQKQLHHPKVVALCRELDGWFNKQTNNQVKILVLLKRGLHTLMEYLEAALRMGNTIIPKIVTNCHPQDILQNLKDHNCLLIPCEHINENFPWVQFSLVVEYEHQDDSPWEGICKSHNISWICMKLDNQIDQKYISAGHTKNQITRNQALRNDIKLIGSQAFLSDSELIHLLETRYNLQFLERDYTALMCGEKMYFSDIDIDEKNCVLLYHLHEVSDESQVERIIERVLALNLKYQHCWMIFMAIPYLGRYPLPSNVTNSLFKLQATLVNFASQAEDFEIQVLVSFKRNDVAKLIWIICEECLPVTSEMDSPVHSWLSTEVFKAEQCLMSFPCFSSQCAQLLLKKLSLQEIFSKSLSELQEIFPSVPLKVFKVFIDLKFSESGVCLPLNSADVKLTSKNKDRPVPFKWYGQQNLEALPSEFRGSENIFREGKPNKNYSKLDSLIGIDNSVESQGQNVTLHELADRSSDVPVKNQNVDIAKLAQRPRVCNNQPLDHCLNNRAFAFSDCQNSSCSSKAWRLSGKNMDCFQQNLFTQDKMHQNSIQHHQLSLDHDAPFTNGKICKDDKERSKSDLTLLASFGAGCQYGKDVRDVQGNSYIGDEDEELLPLNQAKFKPNQYVKGKQQMAHQECIGDLTQKSYNMSVPYEREYVKKKAMIEPSSNLNFSGDRYFENEFEEQHVLGYEKRVPDFKEMSIRNHVPEPFPTTRSVYMGDNLESTPFCRILAFQTECPQKQNRHTYNSSQTQKAYVLGQHENMKGACSKRNQTGYGNTVPLSYPYENESLPRNMKSLNRDFENNLSETTRKLLQSPFQFSRFDNYITRPQQQRIRVGLAQPLRRITTETEERNGSEMQQSFWTNGDSPPMDLESNPQAPISDLLKLGNDQLKGINEKRNWNRQACVTAATPKRVRKLAYERVNGVKGGQTKLVFR